MIGRPHSDDLARAALLESLARTWALPTGNLEIPTLYPPGALAAFAAAASAGPSASVFVWKAFVAAADLYRMLAGRLRAPRRSAT